MRIPHKAAGLMVSTSCAIPVVSLGCLELKLLPFILQNYENRILSSFAAEAYSAPNYVMELPVMRSARPHLSYHRSLEDT
jgi:hypothetical protein